MYIVVDPGTPLRLLSVRNLPFLSSPHSQDLKADGSNRATVTTYPIELLRPFRPSAQTMAPLTASVYGISAHQVGVCRCSFDTGSTSPFQYRIDNFRSEL